MKKYLISIESTNSERLKKLYSQPTFYKYRDEFKQFGVIGKNLSVSEYFQQGVAGKKKPMTPGELGCTMSHIAALKDFLSSDEEYAIIFEDDVIERFEVDFNELEEQVKRIGLTTPLFLSLGGIQMKICRKVKGKYQPNFLLDQHVLKVDPFFYENLAYAYAYIVDREMAKILIDFHRSPRVYDQWADLIISKKSINIYVSYIFDHPEIENEKDKSYLENERDMLTKITKNKLDFDFSYIVKKIKGFFLQNYKLNT